MSNNMKIFIGSSLEAAKEGTLLKIAGMLRDWGAEPVPWNSEPTIFKPGMFVIESIEEIIERAHINAAIFIYS